MYRVVTKVRFSIENEESRGNFKTSGNIFLIKKGSVKKDIINCFLKIYCFKNWGTILEPRGCDETKIRYV